MLRLGCPDLSRVVREGFTEEVAEVLREAWRWAMQMWGRKHSLGAGGPASAKAQRQGCAWGAPGAAKSPLRLELRGWEASSGRWGQEGWARLGSVQTDVRTLTLTLDEGEPVPGSEQKSDLDQGSWILRLPGENWWGRDRQGGRETSKS